MSKHVNFSDSRIDSATDEFDRSYAVTIDNAGDFRDALGELKTALDVESDTAAVLYAVSRTVDGEPTKGARSRSGGSTSTDRTASGKRDLRDRT